MKSFKFVMPMDKKLKEKIVMFLNGLYKDCKLVGAYNYYCFKNNFPTDCKDDYQDFLSWPEPEITITELLNMEQKSEPKKPPLLEWVRDSFFKNKYVMGKYPDKKWIKIILSHIGEENFISTGGLCITEIAPLCNLFLGTETKHENTISFKDLQDYDLSDIPGYFYNRGESHDNL